MTKKPQKYFEKQINKAIKNSSTVDMSELSRNLKVLNDLRERGVNVGPDYNLVSPYSRPSPCNSEDEPTGSILHSA